MNKEYKLMVEAAELLTNNKEEHSCTAVSRVSGKCAPEMGYVFRGAYEKYLNHWLPDLSRMGTICEAGNLNFTSIDRPHNNLTRFQRQLARSLMVMMVAEAEYGKKKGVK